MASIFSQIVAGNIPSHKVAETDDFLAFLDISYLLRVHKLVIPIKEIDYLFDLPDDLYLGLHIFARKVADAVQRSVPCKRIATAVVGLEVPHAHIHLVPIDAISDLNFENPRVQLNPEEFTQLAGDIRSNLR